MSNKQKRFFLTEEEIPTQWYNIQADMPNKPLPPLNPKTKQPMAAEDLYPIFAKELCHQELNTTDSWIDIPEVSQKLCPSLSTPPHSLGRGCHRPPRVANVRR